MDLDLGWGILEHTDMTLRQGWALKCMDALIVSPSASDVAATASHVRAE